MILCRKCSIRTLLFSAVTLWLSSAVCSQVTTSDIPRWYEMLDAMANAESKEDSISIIQTHYLEPATPGLKLFAKARSIREETIMYAVRTYPKYYASIRGSALAVDEQRAAIDSVLQLMTTVLPDIEVPKVTIAFGIMNSGGTAVKGHILIGAGMNLASASADTSELSPWLLSNIIPEAGEEVDITAMVAHEAVHTRQGPLFGWAPLETQVIGEGVCDFIVHDLLGYEAKAPQHRYGAQHECAVWRDFEDTMNSDKPRKQSLRWLYGGDQAEPGRPADLGYYVGRRISAAYYDKAADKEQALRTLMKPSKYKRVYRDSGYDGNCSSFK